MIENRWSSVKRGVAYGASSLLMLAVVATTASYAQTVAYWDFEDGTAGAAFTPAGAENGSGGSVDTVNGILMRGWDDFYGPSFSDFTPEFDGSLSMRHLDAHQDGYVLEGALHNWTPTAWTIETTVYLEDLAGWNTLVGRDGSTISDPAADFYFQNDGEDDTFRINYLSAGGTRWILDGTYDVQPSTWYALAAMSDGSTLSMWLDDGGGYQQIGSLDISAQSVADNALADSALNWTFGRGWYNGNFVDHISGYQDNIRFSEGALSAGQLIPLTLGDTIVLQVNKTTGEVTLSNGSAVAISMDYYLIESAGGALSTAGWNSLADQGIDAGLPADFDGNGSVNGADLTKWSGDYGVNGESDANGDGISSGADFLAWQTQFGQAPGPGDGLTEAGGADANELAELFLSGATTLAPGESISLGNAYNTSVFGAADGDLTLQFATAGGGLLNGSVSYVTGAVGAVPEPATLSMIVVLAAGGLAVCRRGR